MKDHVKLLITCALLFTSCHVFSADIVKLSTSGICHTKDSPWYEKTKNFKAYASVENCIEAGGRLASNSSRSRAAANTEQYDRSMFPHWIDADGDCQDTRAETLIAQSVAPVTFQDRKQCYVTAGKWYDPYTNQYYFNDDDLDIDHKVPLLWAYLHGAKDWPKELKQAFANDPQNLIAVKNSANRSKGAKGPSEWLPEYHGHRCGYIGEFVKIVNKYKLQFKASEKRIIDRQLNACKG